MYYYALINPESNVIEDVCINVATANKKLAELREDMIVRPIMLEAEYAVQSKDIIGHENGNPYLRYMSVQGIPIFGPVILVKNWSFWSHLKYRCPAVELLKLPPKVQSLMMCVDNQSDTIQISICAPSYGIHVQYPAMTKSEIVRHWILDSFSCEDTKLGLLFDTAVLRLVPDYITNNELYHLRSEFFLSLKQV